MDLIEWMCGVSGAENEWKKVTNIYGYTAEELYADAVALWPKEQEGRVGNIPRFCKDMYYSEERASKKEEWWKGKLLSA
jgi:hypothetical protein